MEPRWTQGNKEGVGTAYSGDSPVWFTLFRGIVTEVYYPTVDRPQIRDLQLLITDGKTFFHEEKRHLPHRAERLSPHALGYRISRKDPTGRYSLTKDVIAAPHLPCILQKYELGGEPGDLAGLRIFVLCAPHINVGGWGNNARVMEAGGRRILAAEKDGTWLALGTTVDFSRTSVGYVGKSDGWTDLHDDRRMDWEFNEAPDGNVALMGELDLRGTNAFTVGLAFGVGFHHAVTTLFQALGVPFEEHRERFLEEWERSCRRILPLEAASGDGGNLYHSSYSLLLAHEDKAYPGAFIASLSIPWGEAKGDEDMGGYHLVWTRDMVNTATALLAAGNAIAPLRALIYLAASQQADGGFPQNFWIDGTPYWRGVQLDEVALPILLAYHLRAVQGLQQFDPYPLVLRAASYLVRHGPATQQERWEEASGYSPSTLATNIAALVCAATFARARGDGATAQYLEEYADFLESHIEAWTVATEGTLVPGVRRHFIRILPVAVDDVSPVEDPNQGMVTLANQPPGAQAQYPAKEIVDGGFLELVRYGIRAAHDPIVRDSLRVVDQVLLVETPHGPVWQRYNHDGYGQRDDGGPFEGWGRGRAWPLLTGERGHYDLVAGADARPYIRAMEGSASATGLLPEQVWDAEELPRAHMRLGHPTGAAMPLMWAHAEYVKLLRSTADGRPFDLIPEVADRYLGDRAKVKALEIWKPNRQARAVALGRTLRVQAEAPFTLHWSMDEWRTVEDTPSTTNALGIHFVDVPGSSGAGNSIKFTFHWAEEGRWEGRDYEVALPK